MPTLTYTYVDNSNFFIEGQRLAAVKKKAATDLVDAMSRGIVDISWQPDYGRLHGLICGQRHEIGAAKLWGSLPPKDSFWEMVKSKGFKVTTFDKYFGKEKKVDVAIAVEMMFDAPGLDKQNSEIILVAGDKDFVPIVEKLKSLGYKVCVVFWDHAANELKQAATSFFSLNKWHDHLTF